MLTAVWQESGKQWSQYFTMKLCVCTCVCLYVWRYTQMFYKYKILRQPPHTETVTWFIALRQRGIQAQLLLIWPHPTCNTKCAIYFLPEVQSYYGGDTWMNYTEIEVKPNSMGEKTIRIQYIFKPCQDLSGSVLEFLYSTQEKQHNWYHVVIIFLSSCKI